MKPSPHPESSRIELLRLLELLDSTAEPAFDALIQAASIVCQCPISLISLVDVDRQWFKATVGLDVHETPRDQAFCAHAVRGTALFEIPDATVDARFADNPLVTGDPRIRFYAGQPIVFRGVSLGTICVIDRVPRSLTPEQRAVLERLAIAAAELLQGRMDAILHRREATRLQDFAHLSGDWLWESDVVHRCVWLSGDARKASGLFRGTILGEIFRDAEVLDRLGRPTGGPGLLGLFDRAEAFRGAVVRTVTSQGLRYIALSGQPIFDEDGHACGIRGSARDVTDRVTAETAIREREAVLRKIAGQLPGMIYKFQQFADGTSCFPYASDGIGAIYELNPEDVTNDASPAWSRIHPDDVAFVAERVRVSRETGCLWHACYRVQLPDKGLRWLQGSSAPERLADGSTLWHGFITDVTDSHARDRELTDVHEALVVVERRLRAVTDHLPALISHLDREERYTFANAHIGRVFGGDAIDMLGRTLLEVRGPEIYAQVKPYLDRAYAGETVTYEGSGVASGKHHHFQAVYVPDVGSNGEVIGLYAMTFDITDRKNAEIEQATSEKRLRDITDNIPALVCYVDTDERYRFANATYKSWLGVDAEHLVGRSVCDLYDPATYQLLRSSADKARSGERVRFERSAVRDGKEVHYQVEMIPDFGPDGVVLGIYAMTVDITARRDAEMSLARSEQRLLDITNSIPAVIGQFDMHERCLFSNDVGLRVHGISRKDLPTVTFSSHLSVDLYEQHKAALHDVLAGKPAVVHGKRILGDKQVWFTAHLVPAVVDERQYGFFIMTFDVTTLKTAELARARSEQRLRDITDNLPVLISYLDADERITYVNETFKTWVGAGEDQIVGLTAADAIGPDLYDQRRSYIRRCLEGQRTTFEMDSPTKTGTKTLQTTYVPDIHADGRVVGMTALSVDVTSLKQAERRLSVLAHSDALTGLPNRLQFNNELAELLERSVEPTATDALMFLDVDHFKRINDSHGHAAGDAVLKNFARRIQGSVRASDFVARLAGDEFVVILRGLRSIAEAQEVARKVLSQVSRPFAVDQQVLSVTTSVGVAMRDPSIRTASEMLAKADKALYRAKEAGRNTFRLAA